MQRFLWKAIIAGAASLGFLFVVFVVYGWSQGHAPFRAIANLLKPHADAVESNPPLQVVKQHRVTWLGDIEQRDLDESSGLAASNLYPGVVWSMNDSGGDAELFASSHTGQHLARVKVNTDRPSDWEALDAFKFKGQAYIAIGDVGDNLGWRKNVRILIVPEPEELRDGEVTPAWQLIFTYPHGPRDAEAITVDEPNERILILTKREYPQRLYAVPMRSTESELVAEFVGELPGLPQATEADFEEEPDTAQYRYMPSGMDYHAPTDRLLITTYKPAFIYELSDLSKPPLRVPMPSAGQREAITWVSADRAIVSRERRDRVGIAEFFEIEFIEF